ncbi:MAG: hypothetical protein LBM56_05200 [Burkholderiaceae bacterium]|jgi:DNA-binding transcriptional regulator YiaG|nr:hypothetical protein [Burkholderiaceae bacterium]
MKTEKDHVDSTTFLNNDTPVFEKTIERKPRERRGRVAVSPRLQLSKEQQELVDIKNSLGLRHQDFAIMLNIGLPRLASYTYGRTASVPLEVMETARKLMAENHKISMQIREKFDRPMSAILNEWAEKLGTRSDAQLAALLGVAGMTVSRWRKDETMPDLSALNRYDHIVELIASNIASATAK